MTSTNVIEQDPVRLSVNLAPSVADALKGYASQHGFTLTEATRRAVALYSMTGDEIAKGKRLVLVEQDGGQKDIIMA